MLDDNYSKKKLFGDLILILARHCIDHDSMFQLGLLLPLPEDGLERFGQNPRPLAHHGHGGHEGVDELIGEVRELLLDLVPGLQVRFRDGVHELEDHATELHRGLVHDALVAEVLQGPGAVANVLEELADDLVRDVAHLVEVGQGNEEA